MTSADGGQVTDYSIYICRTSDPNYNFLKGTVHMGEMLLFLYLPVSHG